VSDQINKIVGEYGRTKIKLEELDKGSSEYQLIQNLSQQIEHEYHVEHEVAEKVALLGYNESAGTIQSSQQVADYTGITDLTNSIKDYVKDVYLEAGLDTPELSKIDMMDSLMGMFRTEEKKHKPSDENPFDFVNNI